MSPEGSRKCPFEAETTWQNFLGNREKKAFLTPQERIVMRNGIRLFGTGLIKKI